MEDHRVGVDRITASRRLQVDASWINRETVEEAEASERFRTSTSSSVGS